MSDLERLSRVLGESTDAENPPPEVLRNVLLEARTIAVVGLSRDPAKAARRVPSYLAAKGYEVIPVNPYADRILGRTAHPHLDRVSQPVQVVLVFRPSGEAGAVIRSAAARPEAPVIWLQEGIRDDEAARRARAEGRTVVQDLCIFTVHRSMDENLPAPPGPPDGRGSSAGATGGSSV